MTKTTFAQGQLRALVDRIERLEEEKKTIAGDIKEVYAEAKANGFDTKIIKKVIALRKMEPSEREEMAAMLDMYMIALGMQPDLFDDEEIQGELGREIIPPHDAATGEIIESPAATSSPDAAVEPGGDVPGLVVPSPPNHSDEPSSEQTSYPQREGFCEPEQQRDTVGVTDRRDGQPTSEPQAAPCQPASSPTVGDHVRIVSVQRLHELFSLTPEFTLVRKVDRGAYRVGTVAGSVDMEDGYRRVGVDGADYPEHRVVFAMHHGRWPEGEIDHINGCKTDNRPENLREVTKRQNQQNQYRHRETGRKPGCSFSKFAKKWQARAWIDGKNRHLGYFATEDEAYSAYQSFLTTNRICSLSSPSENESNRKAEWAGAADLDLPSFLIRRKQREAA